MPMKNTMNKSDIVKYHKMLAAGESNKKISAALLVEESTLKKFTPEIMDKIKSEQVARNKAAIAKHAPKTPDKGK